MIISNFHTLYISGMLISKFMLYLAYALYMIFDITLEIHPQYS